MRFHESVAEPLGSLELDAGAHTVERVDDDLTVVWLDDGEVSSQLLRTVESSPAVAFAERVPARWLSAVAPADPRHNRQWGLRAIRWVDADAPDTEGVTVAICDTGVDGEHPDLAGVVAAYDHEGASATDIVGHGTRGRVRALLANADVFLLPSLSEGLSLAMLEAMAMELPVVGTRVVGTEETVRDGETGFLVEYGDAEGLADRLALLQRDPALRARLGKRGREVVESEFDERQIVETLAGIYRQLLRAKGVAAQAGLPHAVKP